MIDSITKLTDTLEASLLQPNENGNVDKSERVLSLITGAYVFCKGITNLFSHPVLALSEAAIGGVLLHRGVTGYCSIKAMNEKPEVFEETYVFTEMQQPRQEMQQSQPYSTSSQSDFGGEGQQNNKQSID